MVCPTPGAGDIFVSLEDEHETREIASKRAALHREQEFRATKAVSLADFHSQLAQGGPKPVDLIQKGFAAETSGNWRVAESTVSPFCNSPTTS